MTTNPIPAPALMIAALSLLPVTDDNCDALCDILMIVADGITNRADYDSIRAAIEALPDDHYACLLDTLNDNCCPDELNY